LSIDLLSFPQFIPFVFLKPVYFCILKTYLKKLIFLLFHINIYIFFQIIDVFSKKKHLKKQLLIHFQTHP